MLGGCWADMRKPIGTGRCNGHLRRTDQRFGDWMIRRTNRNRRHFSADYRRDIGVARQDERQRTRPEGLNKLVGAYRYICRYQPQLISADNMDDKRIGGWTT